MRDLGNTLIVVEHDEDTMMACDYLIDIGPGAGIHGGQIVAQGTPEEVMENEASINWSVFKWEKTNLFTERNAEKEMETSLK